MNNLNNVLKDFAKIAKQAEGELTPQQQMELAQFQSKVNGIFNGMDGDLSKMNVDELLKRSQEVQQLAKNITNGISSNK